MVIEFEFIELHTEFILLNFKNNEMTTGQDEILRLFRIITSLITHFIKILSTIIVYA